MMSSVMSRRTLGRWLGFGMLSVTGAPVHAQRYGEARDLVAHIQRDLQRAADFVQNNVKEQERYHNVQHHLSEFDRELARGKFNKGKLDAAIDDLKNVVNNNTLESRDRDALAADLAQLRTLRDVR